MRVLKKKDLIPEVSKSNGVSQETAEKVVNLYWREVKTAIRELKHLNILLNEIGELRIARTRIEETMENMEKYLKKYPEDSPQYKNVFLKTVRLKNLLEMRNKEYEKREVVRDKRKAYDEAKKNMEVEKKDPGGDLV